MDNRSMERIRFHYGIERELGDRLRKAEKHDRYKLYGTIYDELYDRVPDIPHLLKRSNYELLEKENIVKLRFFRNFLKQNYNVMEIGPGDCSLGCEIAKEVGRYIAIDVSDRIVKSANLPNNFKFILSDGCSIPLENESVHLAFSDQVIEHLHPDDALEQLENIYNVLMPGGRYICITPNRLYGPHDVSTHFDDVASGLHLKEYSASELIDIFYNAGFRKVHAYTFINESMVFILPKFIVRRVEHVLDIFPRSIRKGLACSLLFKWILRARVVGIK